MPVFGDFDFETFLTTIKHNLAFLLGFLYGAVSWPFYAAEEFLVKPVIDFFKNLFG